MQVLLKISEELKNGVSKEIKKGIYHRLEVLNIYEGSLNMDGK
jgi:hypothetical protein